MCATSMFWFLLRLVVYGGERDEKLAPIVDHGI